MVNQKVHLLTCFTYTSREESDQQKKLPESIGVSISARKFTEMNNEKGGGG